MYELTKFNLTEHFGLMEQWLKGHGIPCPKNGAFLPPTGYLVSYELKPVVIGFMVKCDNRTAIYQDFVSDPQALPGVRKGAARALRKALDADAMRSDLQIVLCSTSYQAHVENLEAQGYKILHRYMTELGRFLWL